MIIKWSGLADEQYYEYIAKYCLPSWNKLPGDKHIVVDGKYVQHNFLNTVNWKKVGNYDAPFWSIQKERKKTNNFWRKMQSQVWAVRNIFDCDILVLLDTDIEVLDFDKEKFNAMLDDFVTTDFIWATGQSQRRGHDSGFIVFNMHHPKLHELIDYYENIWDSGDIFKLAKSYDGHAVESMFDLYPSYKIPNIDYGSGFHVYDLGLVHYGSKIPKQLRRESTADGKNIVEEFTKDKKVKMSKHPWVLSGPWK
jgi:hypothetical protein